MAPAKKEMVATTGRTTHRQPQFHYSQSLKIHGPRIPYILAAKKERQRTKMSLKLNNKSSVKPLSTQMKYLLTYFRCHRTQSLCLSGLLLFFILNNFHYYIFVRSFIHSLIYIQLYLLQCRAPQHLLHLSFQSASTCSLFALKIMQIQMVAKQNKSKKLSLVYLRLSTGSSAREMLPFLT